MAARPELETHEQRLTWVCRQLEHQKANSPADSLAAEKNADAMVIGALEVEGDAWGVPRFWQAIAVCRISSAR